MQNVFSLIGTSWDFYKSQPVLNAVIFWLFVLPMTAMALLGDYQVNAAPNMGIIIMFLNIALIILLLWGVACCTLVGKRLIRSRAGRARTSFKAVRKQAWRFVMNLLLTDLLRSCFTIFWALLLIVPGIIYQIRTFFYFIAIVCEGKGYRSALEQSQKAVKGKTWTALMYIIGLSLSIFLPLIVIDTAIIELVNYFDERLLIATYFVSSYLYSVGILIFILASISLYAELKKLKPKKS